MYSLEQRLRAVNLYFELGSNVALTVCRLNYPDLRNNAKMRMKTTRYSGFKAKNDLKMAKK